ncbi:hypothetical protein [Desulfosporosinus acidiphilus]|uniref:hypothetical protein n=1 Tax=Desulfosporosinus acidiphilus TaxID=885581 RepID=UPI000257AA70|nr:hypothetical protein [Desulfosporosinus acidiphilus]
MISFREIQNLQRRFFRISIEITVITYKIVLTKQADTDLRAIYEYIAVTLHEPETATKQLERIEEFMHCLIGRFS